MVLNVIIIAVTLALAGYLAFSKRLEKSEGWAATVTPLASIMGSGFLISAPLLAGVVGNLALICMAILLALAYAVGSAIRFNIRHFEPIENDGHGAAQDIAFLSRVVLSAAYFITVTYYIKLLAAFLLNALPFTSGDEVAANSVATVILGVIGGVGMWRGLDKLEKVETFAVSLNLGMIGALLVALAAHNIGLLAGGDWHLPDVSSDISQHDLRVLLGLLIVVQGFETSRYLGDEHPAELRIRTMRAAQLISAAIYLVFIGLATVLFHGGLDADVTAIVNMTRPVAVVLPLLLTIAAIGSQFSAAVADDLGAGGLLEDITHHKLPVRYAYLLILLVTVSLVWATNVNSIIAYASRAFALFYLLQCLVALMVAWEKRDLPHRSLRIGAFGLIGFFCFLVFAFGLPAE
ncbi:MAG: amino acid permease [Verrucomicrobiae bacterium]|nr:amino acid permease [Verrucomicrobiae bacterium]